MLKDKLISRIDEIIEWYWRHDNSLKIWEEMILVDGTLQNGVRHGETLEGAILRNVTEVLEECGVKVE